MNVKSNDDTVLWEGRPDVHKFFSRWDLIGIPLYAGIGLYIWNQLNWMQLLSTGYGIIAVVLIMYLNFGRLITRAVVKLGMRYEIYSNRIVVWNALLGGRQEIPLLMEHEILHTGSQIRIGTWHWFQAPGWFSGTMLSRLPEVGPKQVVLFDLSDSHAAAEVLQNIGYTVKRPSFRLLNDWKPGRLFWGIIITLIVLAIIPFTGGYHFAKVDRGPGSQKSWQTQLTYDGWYYFSDWRHGDNGGFFKEKVLSDNSIERVRLSSGWANEVIITDKYIFYSSQPVGGLLRIKHDGSDKERLNVLGDMLCVDEEFLYFFNRNSELPNGYYRLNMNNKSTEMLVEGNIWIDEVGSKGIVLVNKATGDRWGQEFNNPQYADIYKAKLIK